MPRPTPGTWSTSQVPQPAAVRALLDRLATIPEAIEMARATGLTIGQVTYNAQMIRTNSLLLRAAQRQGIVINSRGETSPLSEHTFILHPVEAGKYSYNLKKCFLFPFSRMFFLASRQATMRK